MRWLAGDELDLASIALDAVRQFVARHETALVHRSNEIADDVHVDGVGVVRLSVPAAE